jgi:hypothetical protein
MFGQALKEEGMQQAIENADRQIGDWSLSAFNLFRFFLKDKQVGFQFMAEQAREFSESRGLEIPPTRRAWGSIVARAKREGLIKHVGFSQVNNPKAHRTNVSVWEKI